MKEKVKQYLRALMNDVELCWRGTKDSKDILYLIDLARLGIDDNFAKEFRERIDWGWIKSIDYKMMPEDFIMEFVKELGVKDILETKGLKLSEANRNYLKLMVQ